MKTTVEIPEKLFRQAKSRAALEGISLRELFVRGLQLALKTPASSPESARAAFPLVHSAASQPRLTDEQVYAALDSDQDLH